MEIVGNTLSDVWGPSVRAVVLHGRRVPTENGVAAFELTNVVRRIQAPSLDPPLPQGYPESVEYVDQHTSTYNASYHGHSINARLYKFGGEYNQIERVIKHLNTHWYTRRAVISTWDPAVDASSTRPPCPIVLSFMVRDSHLQLTAFLRSNDAWSVAVPNIIALTRIQSYVAEQLSLSMGEYCHIAASYHIYKPSFPAAVAALGLQPEIESLEG